MALGAIALNALIIYLLLAALSFLFSTSVAIRRLARVSLSPQEHELRIVIRPPLQLLETFRRRERRGLRLLDHQQRARRQPAAVAQRGQRLLGELSCDRADRETPARTARSDAPGRDRWRRGDRLLSRRRGPSASTLLRSSARASAPLSTNSANAAPRETASMPSAPVPANRSSTRASGNRIVIGMDQDVEQRLAQPVRGRADVARGRRREIAALQSSADDAHQTSTRPAASGRACRDSRAADGAAGRSRWPRPRCARAPPRCRCAAPARGGPCGRRSGRSCRPA